MPYWYGAAGGWGVPYWGAPYWGVPYWGAGGAPHGDVGSGDGWV